MLTCLSGERKTYNAGEVHDFEDNEAQRLVEKGIAKYTGEEQAQESKKSARSTKKTENA